MHPVAATLREIEGQLNAFFMERRDVIRVVMLAILSKEHAYILGPPGTGKSALIRAVVQAIVGARYFEQSLSKTRPAEKVIGPLDIKRFRDSGDYFIKTKGFLLDVEYAFLDEIGKMSPVLGHDLLAALNERVRQEVNGGRSVHPIPLHSAFTASNELITGESDEAAALWDRLLFRVVVDHLQDKSNFATLLLGGEPPVTSTVDFEDLKKVIDVEVPAVKLSQETLETLVRLRFGDFSTEHIYLSDRRWKWSMKALKAQAFLEGRDEIIDEDLAVLRWTLWDTVEQIEKVERMCLAASNPFVDELYTLRSQIKELARGIEERKDGTDENAKLFHGKEVNKKLKIVRDDLDRMLKTAAGKSIPNFKEVADFHESTLVDNYHLMLGLDEDAAKIAASKKLGLGDGTA